LFLPLIGYTDKLEFDEEREKGIGKREKWGYGYRRFY